MGFTLIWRKTRDFWSIGKELCFQKYWRGRKIKEALYIYSQNPASVIDQKKILNLEKGFNLDPIWSGFNESVREIVSKKVQKCIC